MSEHINSIEYAVDKRVSGFYLLQRILLIAGYVVYTIGFLIFLLVSHLVPVGAFIPLSLWAIVSYTWRYVSVSYEFELTMGEMNISKIFGNRSRREMAGFKISDLVWLVPADRAEKVRIGRTISRRIFAVQYKGCPGAYSAGISSDDGKTYTEIIFATNEKALKIMKFHNRSLFPGNFVF